MAVKPLETIPGSEIEPYGQRTALGWGSIGNANPNEYVNDTIVHRTVVQEVEISSTKASNIFTMPTKVKEIYEPQHVRKILKWTISNAEDDEVALSVEDKRLLEILNTFATQK